MDWKSALSWVKEIVNLELFGVGSARVSIATILTIVAIVLTTVLLSRVVRRSLARVFVRSGIDKDATGNIVQRLVHYVILITGIVAALQTIGIDLSTLFAAGAVFAVGIGFAMQNIAQNFVSGVILLVERSIKPGDVLEVDGIVVKVVHLGIRSTVARTRNEEELIIPNSSLVQGTVKNYTLTDSAFLLEATVGVVYSADMRHVRRVLEQVAQDVEWRNKDQDPRILMRAFGDSSVNFSVFVWMSDPWNARRKQSALNEEIWFALKEAGITIAFPQLDIHVDPQVEEALRLLSGRAPSGKAPVTPSVPS